MTVSPTTSIRIADLQVNFSRVSTADLRRMPGLFTMLTNRTWSSDMQMRNQVLINIPTKQGGTVRSIDVSGSNRSNSRADFVDGPEVARAQTVLAPTKKYEASTPAGQMDVVETVIPILEEIRRNQTYNMKTSMEDDVLTYLQGLTTTTNRVPVAADLPRFGTSASTRNGTNNNAGSIYTRTFGSNTDYISPDGEASTDAAKRLVRQVVEHARLIMKENHVYGGYTVDGVHPGQPTVVLHPRLASVLIEDMSDSDYHWDRLTGTTLGITGDGPSIMTGAAYTGRLYGLDIVETTYPRLIPQARDNSGDTWDVWVICRGGVAYAKRPVTSQVLTPATNQTGSDWVVRQWCTVGYQLVQREAILRLKIRSHAS